MLQLFLRGREGGGDGRGRGGGRGSGGGRAGDVGEEGREKTTKGESSTWAFYIILSELYFGETTKSRLN